LDNERQFATFVFLSSIFLFTKSQNNMNWKICLLLPLLSLSFSVSAQTALDDFVKGKNLRSQKQYKQAIEQFDIAISKDASVPNYHYEKALCHMMMQQGDQAIASLEKTVALKPDYVDAHSRLAVLYKKNKQYDQAIVAYDNAYKYETDASKRLSYKLNIITILARSRRIQEAGQHIADAKKLAPDDLQVLYFDAKYNNTIKKYEEAKNSALKAVSKLTSDAPQDIARYYFELGYAYHHLGKYDEKEEAFKKAQWGPYVKPIIELSPQFYHAIALSYFKIYEMEKSKELVETALKMRKDFPQAHDLLVKIASSSTDKSAVIEHQKTAIQTEPNAIKRAYKYADLAELELESGRYEDAIKSADECLQQQPKNYAVVFIKAIAQHKLKNTAQAIKTLDELLQFPGIDPETKAQYNFAMGVFFEKINNTEKALEAYKRAVYGTYKYASLQQIDRLKPADQPDETTPETKDAVGDE
jgi:tetratricopeptide (TPR) repeat protein